MNYSISTQSDTGKKFTLNEQEELFFNALYDYWMQILKGLYTSKTIEGDVENFITHVSDWEKYIKLHCKN